MRAIQQPAAGEQETTALSISLLTRAHRLPRLLVQLVNGGADGAELLRGHARNVQHRVQQPPVVQLDLDWRGWKSDRMERKKSNSMGVEEQ